MIQANKLFFASCLSLLVTSMIFFHPRGRIAIDQCRLSLVQRDDRLNDFISVLGLYIGHYFLRLDC